MKIKNIVNYLHLQQVGLLEMTFALTPLLSGYAKNGFQFSLWMWVILIFLVITREKKVKYQNFMPMTLLFIYWMIHEIIVMAIDEVNINGYIVQFIYFIALYFLFPVLKLDKLRGSLNWVALFSMAGLLYQWTLIARGQLVHQLDLPGLPVSQFMIDGADLRPSSFYTEPSSYVAFMMCPLALSLIDKKYIWSVVIILSIFLTTSTTGLLLSFLILGMAVFGQKFKIRTVLISSVIGIGLFYSLTHFEAFRGSVVKLENTNTEYNVRLTQGRYIVSTMEPHELILGVAYSTPYNYCKSGRAPDVEVYGETVFMSTVWYLILCYGVIGLLLYLNIYKSIFKMNSITLPYIVCLIAVMFSSSYGIRGTYIFQIVFLLVIARSFPLRLSKHQLQR